MTQITIIKVVIKWFVVFYVAPITVVRSSD